MATTIQVNDLTIRIDKTFVSSKDRVTVNGQVVFEGNLISGAPQSFHAGGRNFQLECKTVNSLTGERIYELSVLENGELLPLGRYDKAGKPANNKPLVKENGAVKVCSIVGGVLGFATMMILNIVTGVVPGGAIGGAIGGGGGCALGHVIGLMIFPSRK